MAGAHPFPLTRCIRATHYIKSPDRTMSFTLYWEPAGPVAVADMNTVANDMHDAIAAVWAPLAADSVNMAVCHVRYTDETNDYESFSSTPAIDGANHALVGANLQWLPDFACFIIRRLTGKKGRNARGRLFVPGLCEDATQAGAIAPSYAASVKNFADWIGADRTYGTYLMHARHWSRKTNELQVITSCVGLREVYTRRDREPKGYKVPIT